MRRHSGLPIGLYDPLVIWPSGTPYSSSIHKVSDSIAFLLFRGSPCVQSVVPLLKCEKYIAETNILTKDRCSRQYTICCPVSRLTSARSAAIESSSRTRSRSDACVCHTSQPRCPIWMGRVTVFDSDCGFHANVLPRPTDHTIYPKGATELNHNACSFPSSHSVSSVLPMRR